MRHFVLSPKGRKLHRTLGLIFGSYLIIAAVSGMAHNIMSLAFQPPPPAQPAPPIVLASNSVDPATAARRLGIWDAIEKIELRTIAGRPTYQFLVAGHGRPMYADVGSGRIVTGGDSTHAAEIAARALPGLQLENTAYLAAFDQEYTSKYQTLPVYRFDVADSQGTRIYVSTAAGRVTFWTNGPRQTLHDIFRNFHMLSFLGNHAVQMWGLLVLALGAVTMAILGLAMVWAHRRPPQQ